jgi:hypothetical protein
MADTKKKRVTRIVNKPKSEGGNLTPFTTVSAKAAVEACNRAKALRKQMRAQILEDAINGGIGKLLLKAIQSGDLDQMTICEKAMRLVGLDYASSDEVKHGFSVKASAGGETGDKPSEPAQLKVEFEVVDRSNGQ